jgi:hypothetical protein
MTTKKELLKHIRGKCLDCCCYQPAEVKLCTSLGCALWPFSAVERPTSRSKRCLEKPLPYRDGFR